MKIKIAERLRPFSHEPGTSCLLPSSSLHLQIFPALIRVFNLDKELLAEIHLNVKAPLENFTVMLDLEKGGIRVFAKGGLDYFIRATSELLAIESKKALKMSCSSDFKLVDIDQKTTVLAKTNSKAVSFLTWKKSSALSLGCHKAQDFSLIKRRLNLSEILPHWHRLGTHLEVQGKRPEGGTAFFLNQLANCDKMETVSLLTSLFQTGFEGILFPRLSDEEHQGFDLPPLKEGSPLVLLTDGARLIQELFIKVEGTQISFLPRLHPEFHSGRFIDLKLEGIGMLHFEWSKKLLKKIIFIADKDQTLEFHFQKQIHRCRSRKSLNDRGEKLSVPCFISVEAGKTYYFDRFEK